MNRGIKSVDSNYLRIIVIVIRGCALVMLNCTMKDTRHEHKDKGTSAGRLDGLNREPRARVDRHRN